jgi:hypothetical protein
MSSRNLLPTLRTRPKLLDVVQERIDSFSTDINPNMLTYLNSNNYGIASDDAKSFRQRAAQECLDVLGNLRSHRAPMLGEAWYMPASAERRMLAQVAAVLVLGPAALEFVEQAAIDADIPDPDRIFAAIFILGSAAGKSHMKRCLPIYVAALLRNSEEATAAIEAVCLCPSPNLPESLASLLTHASPAVRAATTRVMNSLLSNGATRSWTLISVLFWQLFPYHFSGLIARFATLRLNRFTQTHRKH